MRKRRYEILLPLKHNDGRPVAPELFQQTWQELVTQFGAITFQPHEVRGIWEHQGTRYEDELFRFMLDVEDTEENQEFFVRFKAVLLERFEQIEIYIASFPIDRL